MPSPLNVLMRVISMLELINDFEQLSTPPRCLILSDSAAVLDKAKGWTEYLYKGTVLGMSRADPHPSSRVQLDTVRIVQRSACCVAGGACAD